MEAEDEAKHSAMHSAEWRFGVAQVSSRGSVETLADLGFGATLVRRSGSGSGSNGEQVEASETDALVLLDEEALFLVDRGQLSVIDRRTREPMTANGLWDAIIRKQPSFPAKYKVYCYFKEKGFVIRTGINFGMDYCLYRDNPSRCHSEFCVQVIGGFTAGESTELEAISHHQDAMSEPFYRSISPSANVSSPTVAAGCQRWRHISSLARVMPDIMKVCLLCFVVPKSLESTSPPSPGSSPYAHLFDSSPPDASTLRSFSDLHAWQVRPVTLMVRRQQVNNERYPTVADTARRFQQSAKLRHARRAKALTASARPSGGPPGPADRRQKRAQKKRRDAEEVRTKGQTRGNTLWSLLLADAGDSASGQHSVLREAEAASQPEPKQGQADVIV